MGYYYAKKCKAWEVKIKGKYLGSFKTEDEARVYFEEKCNEIMKQNIIPNCQLEFKDIPGYDGIYKISKDGVVISYKFNKPKIIKPSVAEYMVVPLYKNGKQSLELLHRLLYKVFIGNIPEKMYVDHIDRNKLNNNLENLRLVTNSQNTINSDKIINAKGYSKLKNGYRANITINGKTIYLGYFKSEEDAHNAYLAAKEKFHII